LRWTWTGSKNRANKRKHRLSFETAQLVFNDPHALSVPDPHPDGDRWRTIGVIQGVTVLVVHTEPDFDPSVGEEVGRIISARKAEPHERKAYEEG
jgi:uncharacterized protein